MFSLYQSVQICSKYFYNSQKYSVVEKYLMGSVSRLEPSGVKSSLGHISKMKLQITLEVGFSYLRDKNVRSYYKISIQIVNKLSISSVSSHRLTVQWSSGHPRYKAHSQKVLSTQMIFFQESWTDQEAGCRSILMFADSVLW